MMHVLYVLRLVKRHVSRQVTLNGKEIKPIALSIVKLCLAGGISKLVS